MINNYKVGDTVFFKKYKTIMEAKVVEVLWDSVKVEWIDYDTGDRQVSEYTCTEEIEISDLLDGTDISVLLYGKYINQLEYYREKGLNTVIIGGCR